MIMEDERVDGMDHPAKRLVGGFIFGRKMFGKRNLLFFMI